MEIAKDIFRAYDIRGEYPSKINALAVTKISAAVMTHLKKSRRFGQPKIIIGHDARHSSPELYRAIEKAVAETGGKIIALGLCSTPMLYYFVNTLKAAGGIMITASHNPKNWNGLKIVKKGGVALSGEELKQIMKL